MEYLTPKALAALLPLFEVGGIGVVTSLCLSFIVYSYRQHAKERATYRHDFQQLQDEHRKERTEWRESQTKQAEYVVREITRISAIIMHAHKE